MVLSYHAALSPGSVRVPAAGVLCTTTTSTTGDDAAAVRVSCARPRSACDLVKCTIRKASSRTTATATAARCSVRPVSLGSKGISSIGCRPRLEALPSQQSIHGRHEHQRRKGGEQQTADDGARQRSVLLAALA